MSARSRGFTLLEVLIALAITAIALALGIGAVRGGAQTLGRLEESSLAQFALDNALNTLALTAEEPAQQQSTETLMGRVFAVTATRSRPTDVLPLSVFNVSVSAAASPELPLASGRREEIDVPLAP